MRWMKPTLRVMNLLIMLACDNRAAPGPLPLDPLEGCTPIFFAHPQIASRYLTKIDGAAPPQTISLPQQLTVRGGTLELHNGGTSYLWAFYSGSSWVGGVTLILAGSTNPLGNGRMKLLVGDDPAQVRGTASVENDGAVVRVSTVNQPGLAENNMGAHEFHFARCP